MGCIIGSLAGCKNSTSTRIAYSLMLVVGTIVACVMLSPAIKDQLEKIPGLCSDFLNGNVKSDWKIECQNVCFAVACFFSLFAIIMVKVKSSKDARPKIQNGFWFFKILISIGLCIAAFFILRGDFGKAWMVIGMIGGFIFIVIQRILHIDFAHGWAESWVGSYKETGSKAYYIGLFFFTVFFYAAAITAVALFYIFYADGESNKLHKLFVSINLILCVDMSVVAILLKIQEYQPRSGLLQASVISAYVMYLTWSAMTNPDGCNPGLHTIINGTETNTSPNIQDSQFDAQSIIALIILICAVLYSRVTLTQDKVNYRHYNIELEMVKEEEREEEDVEIDDDFESEDEDDHDKPCDCGRDKCRLIKALIEMYEEEQDALIREVAAVDVAAVVRGWQTVAEEMVPDKELIIVNKGVQVSALSA